MDTKERKKRGHAKTEDGIKDLTPRPARNASRVLPISLHGVCRVAMQAGAKTPEAIGRTLVPSFLLGQEEAAGGHALALGAGVACGDSPKSSIDR
jgi:hypothetical protein